MVSLTVCCFLAILHPYNSIELWNFKASSSSSLFRCSHLEQYCCWNATGIWMFQWSIFDGILYSKARETYSVFPSIWFNTAWRERWTEFLTPKLCPFVLCFHPLVWWPPIFFMSRHHLIHCMLLKCIQFQYLDFSLWANWGSPPLSTPLALSPSPSRYRCIEEDAGLLDLEPLAGFPKGLEFHKAGEEPYDIKDIFSTSVESEALKETLFRQAKTQVCDCTCSRELLLCHKPISSRHVERRTEN